MKKDIIAAAFPRTIPVLTGYMFLGMAFGVLLASNGYGPFWAFSMAVFVYAGSMQFVAVGLMAAGFNPAAALIMTLMVNIRHVFYGIPMLERFKGYGRAKLYMIFALTDETFSLLCSARVPDGMEERPFYLAIAAQNHFYWIAGCTLGGVIGAALPINTKGIEFVMTALFVVIFLEQWRKRENRTPALIGLGASAACRFVFGPEWFILAAMAMFVLLFSLARKPIEGRIGE